MTKRKPKRQRSINGHIIAPYTVIIDTREQHPFGFQNFSADAADGGGPLVIPTTAKALHAGDYSLVGFESRVAVERKSLPDLYGTFVGDRERGIKQLEKLAQLEFATVVVEADWHSILYCNDCTDIQKHWRNPKTLFRSILAWQQRFPKIHWLTLNDRRTAEHATLRILERFWIDDFRKQEELKEMETVPHLVLKTSNSTMDLDR
jgi:hypothetical protein